MSRIGKMPVTVPAGVEVTIKGAYIKVKGPRGELEHTFPGTMKIKLDDGTIEVERSNDERQERAYHGMTRSLIQNMVTGVSDGFKKVLEIQGVGYRSELDGKNLILHVGYSHTVPVEPPAGVSFIVENRGREIQIEGHDKQAVGQIAANIRKVRPPEPYKGKGIRYQGEYVKRKAGKTGA
jgi:large subunit ribosomal protein L6